MEFMSIRDLKQQAGPVPFAARLMVQLERILEKTTKTGNPFYEANFADAEETLLLRVWNNSPMFATCGQLRGGFFYEVSGEFALGNDGRSIDGKNWTVRAINEEEAAEVLAGSPGRREKQQADYAFIENAVSEIADPRLQNLSKKFLEQYGTRMRRTAAARDYHHARRGGLV